MYSLDHDAYQDLRATIEALRKLLSQSEAALLDKDSDNKRLRREIAVLKLKLSDDRS